MEKNTKKRKNIELLSLITQIPVSLVSKSGKTLYCPTVEEHHYLPPELAKHVIKKQAESGRDNRVPYIHLFSLSILQGVVALSEKEFLFVGPVCITHNSLENSLNAFRPLVGNEEALRLHSILEKFATIDFFRFAGILAAISNNHNDTEYTPAEIINLNFINNIKAKPFSQERYINTNKIPIDSIYFFQKSLFSIIAAGNTDALIKHWQDGLINTLINLDLRVENVNYLCIPFFAYMFNGAVSGGADIHVCFDTYLGQVERFKNCPSIYECITELKRSSYEYCNLVRDSFTLDYKPNICHLCVSYINDHIQEKITVEDLCHVTGLHRNKLYEVFHANFDMTISEYIEKERLRRAVVYLESSNYTLSEIASTMGYANQSHFITIFKKNYGCTPSHYLKNRSYTSQ